MDFPPKKLDTDGFALDRDGQVLRYRRLVKLDDQNLAGPAARIAGQVIALANASDPVRMRAIVRRLLPEVDKSIKSVDGLIADVMEIGATSTGLVTDALAPEKLIEATLEDTFRVYPKARVPITYDLRHRRLVRVDGQKMGRVFANIVGNAVQAMDSSGAMWFTSRDDGDFVELCIGNSGSFIDDDHLPKLFDAFFTSGKKGGTGLGLAIAKKVVSEHGGRIWCESSRSSAHSGGKVEFFFTLPAAEAVAVNQNIRLPQHSEEVTARLLALVGQAQSSEAPTASEELAWNSRSKRPTR